MPPPPDTPKIYHITHVDNIASVVADGSLKSDATISTQSQTHTTIGMSRIKERRRFLPVSCHPGDRVGDYVPFYFCPRSVMLYLIYRGNHPDLAYQGGQEPIVHLEADLLSVVHWADSVGCRWAFSLSNAGASYAEFRCSLANLDEINWGAVQARQWADEDIKEGKQAEFLVHNAFPWSLISRIGLKNMGTKTQATQMLASATYRPPVEVKREWYY